MRFGVLDPCMVYLPTFTIKNQPNAVGKYTIYGCYGLLSFNIVFGEHVKFVLEIGSASVRSASICQLADCKG